MVNFKYVHKSEESNMQDDFLSRPSQDIIYINNVQNLS